MIRELPRYLASKKAMKAGKFYKMVLLVLAGIVRTSLVTIGRTTLKQDILRIM
jgi:hypothetical protein